MELAPKIAFPQLIVVQPIDKLDYLSYIRGGGRDTDGYLRFSEGRVDNPFAKFEVEFFNNDLVHVRSCQNNKYWERTKNLSLTGSTSTQYWITATADKKEEDQSKESCTLFKIVFVNVNSEEKRVRFMHVQSGCYLRLWKWNNQTYTRCVLANHKDYDSQSADVFTIIDWSSLLILPRYVAFKGDIGRLTTDGKTNCLNAGVSTLTRDAQLRVAEAVLTREIYGVLYDFENARVYNETVLSLDERTSTNHTQQSSTLDVTLSYSDTKTSSWNTMFSLKLGVTSTMEFKLPLIFEGKIEMSGEFQSEVEWGKTTVMTTLVEAVHEITVPPRTEATVTVFATKGMCDVPFTYLQRDTLLDGRTVISEVQGGIFTGSNYYNIDFVIRENKLV
ncbi:hypothetical protein V6N13_050493 [Hibiscus sabdariffa]